MKRFISVLFLSIVFASCSSLFADDGAETLFGGGPIRHGGYGGPEAKFTTINKDQFAVMFGGRGGWIINSTFSIGGGGYGLVTRHEIDRNTLYRRDLEFGYGGLFLEYINNSDKVFHFTVNTLIGGGGVTYSHRYFNDNLEPEITFDDKSAPIFVIEPGITAEVNLLRFMRVAFGASYRYTSGANLSKTTDSDLSGFSGSVMLKFGKF